MGTDPFMVDWVKTLKPRVEYTLHSIVFPEKTELNKIMDYTLILGLRHFCSGPLWFDTPGLPARPHDASVFVREEIMLHYADVFYTVGSGILFVENIELRALMGPEKKPILPVTLREYEFGGEFYGELRVKSLILYM